MRFTAQRLLDKARYWARDKTAAQQGQTWTDQEVLDALNETQERVIATVLGAHEDYFGVYKDRLLDANTSIYPLFDGFLQLRKIDHFAGSETDPSDVIEGRLIEGAGGTGSVGSAYDSQYHYALYGDDLHLSSDGGTIREWFLREPGPILLEFPTFPAADQIQFAGPDAPNEADIMVGTEVECVSGTGSGQKRKITAWTAGRLATVDTPFSPVLVAGGGTPSKVATYSRMPRLFQTMLVYGAAIRLRMSQDEDVRPLVALYNECQEQLENFVEQARTGAQRGSVIFDPDDGVMY